MPDQVECISSTTYPDRPIALFWQGERQEITGILNRWRSPDGLIFQVQTAKNQIFRLYYAELTNQWMITEETA